MMTSPLYFFADSADPNWLAVKSGEILYTTHGAYQLQQVVSSDGSEFDYFCLFRKCSFAHCLLLLFDGVSQRQDTVLGLRGYQFLGESGM